MSARAADPAQATRPARAGGTWRRRFLPPQHGAWAMLAVPYLAGLISAGYRWPDVPLAAAWLAGYLLSFFVFQAVKSRRVARYRAQLLVYGGMTVPLAVLVVAVRPQVLWYAPIYAVLFAVNAWYARRRQERALLNDTASVLESCLMVLVVATVAGTAPGGVLDVFVLCRGYFLGTVFYVKTMIRQRGNPAFQRWSVRYHLVALAAAVWVSPWAAGLFAWLLVRAAVLPGRGWSPKRVGLVEMANCLLLLGCAALI